MGGINFGGEEIKNWWGESTGVFFQLGGGMCKFLAGGETPPIPPVRKNLTSVHNNVISKPPTCDSIIECSHKRLQKNYAVLKNCNVVNYVSEPINRNHSTSRSSSGFVNQPVHLNKSK